MWRIREKEEILVTAKTKDIVLSLGATGSH
jgi:hypothetical protein